jgi:lysophospholipase L1-like esterase
MRWRRILVVLAVFVGSVLAADLALATWSPFLYRKPSRVAHEQSWSGLLHRPSRIPGLDYELAPDADLVHREVRVRTNSLGMRSPEPDAARAPGSLRIGVLGDSIAFGFGVEDDQTWSAQLQFRLEHAFPGRRIEVLNCAISGHGTREERLVLEHKLLPLQPDLVILGYFLNDPEWEPVQQLRNHFHAPEWWQHSELARRLAYSRRKSRIAELGGGDLLRCYHNPAGEPWLDTVEELRGIKEACAARGVPVALMITPLLAPLEDWPSYAYADLHAQVLGQARALGYEAYDATRALAASGKAPASLRIDESHPNAEGHALVAEGLADWLQARSLIGPR